MACPAGRHPRCYFRLHRGPREAGGPQPRDVRALVADVVELEDHGVGLTAIDTGVFAQVLPHQLLIRSGGPITSCPGLPDELDTILHVPTMLIGGRTRATSRSPRAGVP